MKEAKINQEEYKGDSLNPFQLRTNFAHEGRLPREKELERKSQRKKESKRERERERERERDRVFVSRGKACERDSTSQDLPARISFTWKTKCCSNSPGRKVIGKKKLEKKLTNPINPEIRRLRSGELVFFFFIEEVNARKVYSYS